MFTDLSLSWIETPLGAESFVGSVCRLAVLRTLSSTLYSVYFNNLVVGGDFAKIEDAQMYAEDYARLKLLEAQVDLRQIEKSGPCCKNLKDAIDFSAIGVSGDEPNLRYTANLDVAHGIGKTIELVHCPFCGFYLKPLH